VQEEIEQIDSDLLKRILLLGPVVPAVCNVGDRLLMTVQVRSDVAKNAG